VRDAAVRNRFQTEQGLLSDALAQLGLAVTIGVQVRATGEDEWIRWLLGEGRAEGERAGVDVKA